MNVTQTLALLLLFCVPALIGYGLYLDHVLSPFLTADDQERLSIATLHRTIAALCAALAVVIGCLLLFMEAQQRQSIQMAAQRNLGELQRSAVIAAHQELMVAMLDSEGKLDWCNGRFAQAFNIRHSEQGHHISDLLSDARVSTDPLQQICTSVVLARETQCDLSLVTREGLSQWYDVNIKPLHDRQGRVTGLIMLMADITPRRIQQQQLETMAYYDLATNLPNRSYFLKTLRTMLQRDQDRPTLLYIRFPRAASMRGSLGNEMSDELVRAIVTRLQDALPAEHVLGRLSGSSFAIIAPIQQPDQAMSFAKTIQGVLARPYTVTDREIQMVSSIGVTVAGKEQRDPAALLRDAEIAMQQVASSSIDEVVLFDVAMRQTLEERQSIENDLRRAIYFEPDQLMVAFQPIMDLTTLDLIGFEALARWKHPKLGFVPPDKFIQIAEETGLIVPLWNGIFANACRQVIRWHQVLEKSDRQLFCSVNLSSVQFFYPGLLKSLSSVIEMTGVHPAWLKFEITESGMMEHADAVLDQLNKIKELGSSLSIDDFGTGYSSLSYLQRLPVDDIKIDRSFVLAMQKTQQDREIVRIITELGRILKKRVIAEGVETEADLLMLRQLGCEAGQGYYFHKPLFAEAAMDVVLKFKAKTDTKL